MLTYAIIHAICSFIFIWYGNKVIDWNGWDKWAITVAGIFWWPLMLLVIIALHPPTFEISNPFKRKREAVPWTCWWYLWWEKVEARWRTWVVIGAGFGNQIHVLWVNSEELEWVYAEEITSTAKPSELAEELAMLDRANKLLEKADAIVKEAWDIKAQAVKKRTNLIFKP